MSNSSAEGGRDLRDEAIDWIARLRSGRATPADHAAFAAWRRTSTAHEAAAREAETLWLDLGNTPSAAAFARRRGALHAGGDAESRHRDPANHRRPGRRTLLVGAIAASVLVAVMAPVASWPPAGLYSDYATSVGERRRIQLPDGSIAFLNTATALSVSYSDATRRVVLHAGEALFEVTRDPGRPFIVAAAGGEAQALGTAFAVRDDGGSADVLVREGSVMVRGADGSSARLEAGQHATLGPDRNLVGPVPIDTAAATAWTRGKLIFNRRALGEVMAELERYQTGRIIVIADRLRQVEVTGVFDLDDPAGLLRVLERTLGVEVVRLPFVTLIR
ncbi:FecR family protein [Arenibaculum pallidiluteum]|uniref:FecR family protein n=1 Tax=Arenibaculum pallidiluteum TaxID=2812559 RepID=UPI001A9730BC|nr:FecR domain-containing protein [Arenibaculum pallidiluteum]